MTRFAFAALLVACSPAQPSGGPAPPPSTPVSTAVVATKVTAFAVDNENLQVDKVGMKDGQLRPDGNRDHAFDATVDGPFDAIFIVETNQKGEPTYGYRADTLVGNEDLPHELAGVIDTGSMTIGLAVSEGGKFINGDSGSVSLTAGVHQLKIYGPNTNTLAAGDFVRIYVRTAGGALVPGPVASY